MTMHLKVNFAVSVFEGFMLGLSFSMPDSLLARVGLILITVGMVGNAAVVLHVNRGGQ